MEIERIKCIKTVNSELIPLNKIDYFKIEPLNKIDYFKIEHCENTLVYELNCYIGEKRLVIKIFKEEYKAWEYLNNYVEINWVDFGEIYKKDVNETSKLTKHVDGFFWVVIFCDKDKKKLNQIYFYDEEDAIKFRNVDRENRVLIFTKQIG